MKMSLKDEKIENESDKKIIKIKTKSAPKYTILQFFKAKTKTPDDNRRLSLDIRRSKSPQKVGQTVEDNSDSWPRMKPINRSISNVRRLIGDTPMMASETRLTVLRQNSVDLVWSKECYGVGDIIEFVEGKWPVIVKVEEGCNRGEHGLAGLVSDQVLQVFAEGRETRMKSMDPSGRLFSVSITDSHFTNDVQIYESRHLAANLIQEGWLDTKRIFIIAEELNISFRLAQGLRDADLDEWTDYCGMYSRAGRAVKLDDQDNHTVYPGVIYEDECNGRIQDTHFQQYSTKEEVCDVQNCTTDDVVCDETMTSSSNNQDDNNNHPQNFNLSTNHVDCNSISKVSSNQSSRNSTLSNNISPLYNNDSNDFSKMKYSTKETKDSLAGIYSSTINGVSASDLTREYVAMNEMDNKGYVNDEIELPDSPTNSTELHVRMNITENSDLDDMTSWQGTSRESLASDNLDVGYSDKKESSGRSDEPNKNVYKKRYAPAYF